MILNKNSHNPRNAQKEINPCARAQTILFPVLGPKIRFW